MIADEQQPVNGHDNAEIPAGEDKEVRIKSSELARLKDEAASFKDKYLRLIAEFENNRKRSVRERTELLKYANEELIVELLNIIDDLHRSEDAIRKNPGDNAVLLKGVELIHKQLHELLKRHDVKPIDAVGKPFDPHAHEALMIIEDPGHEDGKVIDEFQKGYIFADKVVRTAKVKVVKNKNGNASHPEAKHMNDQGQPS